MTMTTPLPHDATAPTTVVVIGFPKSGNTWLARLLADAFNAPVHERLIDNHVEFASSVNGQLRQPVNPAVRIAKIHDLPETFEQREIAGRFRYVYIHRDPRDVAVSAFFHFSRWEDASIRPLFERGSSHPWRAWRRRRAAAAIRRFVRHFAQRGIPRLERKLGRWDQHVQAWRLADVPLISVAYEQLLADTPTTLSRLVRALAIDTPQPIDVAGAAARQSFANTRKQFEEATGDSALPLGRQFGLRFMRRGVIGDWRTFLAHEEVDRIRARFAETFNQLGYNREWDEVDVADVREAA